MTIEGVCGLLCFPNMFLNLMHTNADLKQFLWAELINAATHVLNRTSPSNINGKFPFELCDHVVPSTYAEAALSEDSSEWKKPMHLEIQSLMKNKFGSGLASAIWFTAIKALNSRFSGLRVINPQNPITVEGLPLRRLCPPAPEGCLVVQENPTWKDWTPKRLFRYLNGTANLGLLYKREYKVGILESFSDADHGGDKGTGRSTSGVVRTSWLGQKQPSVSISTTEAEVVAAIETARKIRAMRRRERNDQLQSSFLFFGGVASLFQLVRDVANETNVFTLGGTKAPVHVKKDSILSSTQLTTAPAYVSGIGQSPDR
ncbi:hypothetical protein ILUMI_24365 [Ignelater luminosus]|uniref:Uncharacterized protein n=1 Tax=Ignelater luminosus TaxID=2038154 RepID=A0A8K0C997_IGNLU|nr:hypothetical protein ILUMI_24365 [Ignelater luminosus]